MILKLHCLDPVTPVEELYIERLPQTVGRSQQADIRLADCWASRLHCELRQLHDMLMVRDLGSSNGTYVNGERIEECQLEIGDKVTIGISTFVVEAWVPDSSRYELLAMN